MPGGVTYDGEWMHDLMDGKGKLTFENGDSYEGTFVHGQVCCMLLTFQCFLSIRDYRYFSTPIASALYVGPLFPTGRVL